MLISPSEESFYLSIWFLLDEINTEIISGFDENKEISIPITADTTQLGPKGPFWQGKALDHLVEKGVIKDLGEKVEVLIKDGQKTIAYLLLPCKATMKFFTYYDRYKKIINENLFDKLTIRYGKELVSLEYEALNGHNYSGNIGRDTNSHKLLMYLLTHPEKMVELETLAKELNENRSKTDDDSEKRVRDALAVIKKNMKFNKEDYFIYVKNGAGLKRMIIEIKPEPKNS